MLRTLVSARDTPKKMYNGLPCASTTRYWDGQKGACGCGSSDTNPFSWQWTKPTAAASAPIFGSATWCGTGCGKCFKLTPTAIGASAEGTGAPALTPLVVKVTNLCPYGGNEVWCAYDINSFNYDAHFDLMDYNMDGLISSMGWNNPEVTYEEVDCDANGYVDWGCQCTDEATDVATPTTPTTTPSAATTTTQAPTAAPTSAPTQGTTAVPSQVATSAPTQVATSVPTQQASTPVQVPAGGITIQTSTGSNGWWFGLSVASPLSGISSIEIMDTNGAISTWTRMAYQGNDYWNLYSISTSSQMQAPFSLRITTTSGQVTIANNIISSFTAATINVGVAV